MKKIPYQFITNTVSLLSIGFLVYWSSHGGLRKHIIKPFGSDALSSDIKDRVGHISDLLFYYALIATALAIIISFLQMLPSILFSKLQNILPGTDGLLQLLMGQIHRLIIFSGIYVYLIYHDGMGLNNKQIVLFPFWFLVTIVLQIVGKALTALANQRVDFSSAAYYLNLTTIGLMLAQIYGYEPFKQF